MVAGLLFCLPLFASSQQLRLITINQLYERVSKGRDTTYVVNFWATWCVPCIKEIPSFEKLNAQFKNEKLKVLLISVDFKTKENKAVTAFLRKRKIKSTVFLLAEKNQQQFIDRIEKNWSGAIPATLFIKGGTRRFFEKEFTYSELANEYQTIK